ncbi:geranylgeranyl transferase type-2 subunit alpha, partial [Striga asiatica]
MRSSGLANWKAVQMHPSRPRTPPDRSRRASKVQTGSTRLTTTVGVQDGFRADRGVRFTYRRSETIHRARQARSVICDDIVICESFRLAKEWGNYLFFVQSCKVLQFTAFAALTEEANSSPSSSSGTKPQPDDGRSEFFWHHGHNLGIWTFVLVPLYRAVRDAFMDAYNRYVISCDSRANTGDELDGNALFLDIMEKEVMKHSKTLLLLSCDFGTAWNSKRWAIKMIAAKCANLLEILVRESELVKTLAEKSKMNYRAWNHRCWMVSYMSNSQVRGQGP